MVALLLLTLFVSPTYGNQSPKTIKNLAFDPGKMDIGTRYHYLATNTDNTNPVHIYVYVKSSDTLIIYRDYSGLNPKLALLQTVKFNWDYMMAEAINGVNPLNPQKINYFKVGSTANFAKKTITFRESAQTDYVVLDHYANEPCYSYETFHIDLQFALRFLSNPKEPIVLNDYFYDQIREARVRYLYDEEVNGNYCRKYEMQRLGILADLLDIPKAYFWLARDDSRHYTVQYINFSPRDGIWPCFKMELMDMRWMSAGEWDDFVNSAVVQANSRL